MKSAARILMTVAVLVFVVFITISFAILLELEDLEYNKQAFQSNKVRNNHPHAHGHSGKDNSSQHEEGAAAVSQFSARLDNFQVTIFAYQHGIWRLRFVPNGPPPFEVGPEVTDENLQPISFQVNYTHGSRGCVFTPTSHSFRSSLQVPCSPKAATELESSRFVLLQQGKNIVNAELCTPSPCVTTEFPMAGSVHGIPGRTMPFSLPDASYRLYNRDIFQYPLNHPQGLYGAIPFLIGHSATQSSGVLWLNAADSSVTISTPWKGGRTAKWAGVGGIVDLFLFPGPTQMDVVRQLSWVSGPVTLPPLFSLGYHQCRWSYTSQRDVLAVDAGFDQHDIPYDVIWLDIDHTRGDRYFTWDRIHFPRAKEMQAQLRSKGRHLVCITDPHIKRDPDWQLFREATSRSYFIKDAKGKDFEGWCWPGQSSWLDFHNPSTRTWYAQQFGYDRWEGSTQTLHAWIDMNEPSVFNHFETTLPTDTVHFNGHPHSHQHNLYGFYQSVGAYAGLRDRDLHTFQSDHSKLQRPFVLTRSFFAGSQRYAAAWTGDNQAEWSHLAVSVPMILTLSVAAMPFVGADVGGFFGNPDPELLVRWYQLGSLYPFFRGHSHKDSPRREPWLFGSETTSHIRTSILFRYRLLPYLYTAFRLASLNGHGIWAPMAMFWPEYSSMEDQFYVGHSLMAKPVLAASQDQVTMALPGAGPWYDFHQKVTYDTPTVTISASLSNFVPLVQHAGTIVPLWSTVPTSTGEVQDHPRAHTLQIALDSKGEAMGSLYVDDGSSFGYTVGRYLHRLFQWCDGRLSSSPLGQLSELSLKIQQGLGVDAHFTRPVAAEISQHPDEAYAKAFVNRIIVMGLPAAPSSMVATLKLGHPQAEDDPDAIRTVGLSWKDGCLTTSPMRINLLHPWTLDFND